MRRRAVLAALLLPVLPRPAAAQTTQFRDAQGRVTGRAETRGTITTYYDAEGRSTGRAEGPAAPFAR